MFEKSELILNKDGSIYHLQLRPEHISDIIITVGDQDRVSLVSKHFDTIEDKIFHREFITHVGYLGNKRITVVSTGIGTDNIDIVLNELHLLANFDFSNWHFKNQHRQLTLIRIGTSGCIQADIPVDSYLLSDFAIGIDSLLHFYEYKNSEEEIHLLEKFKIHSYYRNAIHPYISSADKELVELYSDQNIFHGITLTAPGFYAPQGRNFHIHKSIQTFYENLHTFTYKEQRITNIEMETAGIYGLGNILGHKCISLNALLANRATGIFSKQPQKTIEGLIQFTLANLSNL